MTKREKLIINVAVEIDRLLTDGIEIHPNSPIHEKLNQALRQPVVSNRIYTVVDQDGDLINCWKNKEDAEKHAENLRKKHGTHFEATEEPLF